ncbi:AGR263Cp [Eremothecium gossypii ATCC 10895]|uniref:AGR263Cp n=1 Tax=Eremothecium gossypii (strain ATCC 10895 / CBS 109.51 / FGSC 9923 / NRRL Y-1056) TaxID=284811 RepID=Q74ZD6_EREGS|nr:AGR263Cp [Eremothecium gossypii ATCC 10895]AAS54753.1 AGR263Cp [Eremothecium gossypii ATCC 10895]
MSRKMDSERLETHIKWRLFDIKNELYFVGLHCDDGLVLYIYSPFQDLVQTKITDEELHQAKYQFSTKEAMEILLTQGKDVEFTFEQDNVLQLGLLLHSGTRATLELPYNKVQNVERYDVMSSLSFWQMRSILALTSMNEELQNMLVEKDSAIEFLGYTAKEYGGSRLIRRWAPIGSQNYESLTKFKPGVWKKSWVEKYRWKSKSRRAALLANDLEVLDQVEPSDYRPKTPTPEDTEAEDAQGEFREDSQVTDSFLATLSEAEFSDRINSQ